MKFLCVSDMIDPLVYSTTVKERYGDVDAVFCAGDLPMDYIEYIVTSLGKPTFFVFGNHNLSEFKYYKNPKSAGSEIELLKHRHGADYVSNRVIRCKNLNFTTKSGKKTPLLICGVSGSRKYNNGECQYTDFQMKMQLLRMAPSLIWNKIRYGRYCDIFLTHASPRHIHDKEDPCHVGFESFNWFIKKFEPSLLIHGHIHLYDLQEVRSTISGKTNVINCYAHLIIEFNQEINDLKSTKSKKSLKSIKSPNSTKNKKSEDKIERHVYINTSR